MMSDGSRSAHQNGKKNDVECLPRAAHSGEIRKLPDPRERDVIVIGAGPTGAIAAHCLAKSGRDVLLLERARFPRFKVCGGCLNARALAALSGAGLENIPADLGAVSLNGFALHTRKRSVAISLPGGLALSRSALDHALSRAAVASGAELAEGITGKPKLQSRAGWSVSVSNGIDQGDVRARVLLIASGLGTKPMTNLDVVGTQKIWPDSRLGGGTILTCDPTELDMSEVKTGIIHMSVCGHGYVGVVRMEDNQIGIAASFDAQYIKSSGGLANAAADVLKSTGRTIPERLFASDWRGTPLLTRKVNPVSGWRFLVAGDAAGYVEPFTGEGMAWAMTAGLRAASLIDQGCDQWSSDLSSEWEAWHSAHVASSQRRCRPIVSALRKNWVLDTGAATLTLMPWLAKPLTDALNAPVAS